MRVASSISPVLCSVSESVPLRSIHAAKLDKTMVLLTMTPAIVAAVERYNSLPNEVNRMIEGEPSLPEPACENPISHGQLVEISKRLRDHCDSSASDASYSPSSLYHLSDLLRGSRVYVEPPKPKAEPVSHTFFVAMSLPLTTLHRALNTKR